jgi:threonine/homoserine/homoserine lactone efflux protein
MDFFFLLKGFIIGFALPIPLGPAGILCIQRTITYSRLHGFLTGLSAALTDMAFSLVAAFGVTYISDYISLHQQLIHLVGGIVLLVLGYRTYRSRPIYKTTFHPLHSPMITFFSTFFVTFTNPTVIAAYAAVFASIGIRNLIHDHLSASLLVVGVFAGSLGWFSLLTLLSSLFTEKFISHGIFLINRIAGSLILLFGFIALWSGLSTF